MVCIKGGYNILKKQNWLEVIQSRTGFKTGNIPLFEGKLPAGYWLTVSTCTPAAVVCFSSSWRSSGLQLNPAQATCWPHTDGLSPENQEP